MVLSLKKQKIWGTLTPKERMSKARNRFFIDQVSISNWKETTFYESYLSLIDSLNSSGVTVILVSYPITKEYFDLTKNHSVVNQIKYFYKKLSQNNDYVFYFDLSNSITESNLFHDQDHLNLLGTKIQANTWEKTDCNQFDLEYVTFPNIVFKK